MQLNIWKHYINSEPNYIILKYIIYIISALLKIKLMCTYFSQGWSKINTNLFKARHL